MGKITKSLAAAGVAAAMFLPLFAMAAPAHYGEPVLLAQAADLSGVTANMDKVGDAAGLSSSNRTLPEIIGAVINAALGLLGIILVVLVIYAGYLWMMAQGNAAQVDKAKGIMVNAVIGLIILMASYAIANFVLEAIMKSTISA